MEFERSPQKASSPKVSKTEGLPALVNHGSHVLFDYIVEALLAVALGVGDRYKPGNSWNNASEKYSHRAGKY